MELNQIFKLPLKKLAVIAVAQYFWQRPDIEKRMKDDLERRIDEWEEKSFNSPDSYDERKEHVCILGEKEVINFICIQIDSLPIPEKLSQEIKMVVFKMWLKANYWRRYILKECKLDELYTEKIYWTSHGEINQLKIVLDFWCKDIKISDNDLLWEYHQSSFIETSLFCIALIHAENLKNPTLMKAKNYFFESAPVLPEGVYTTSTIIAKWILFRKRYCDPGSSMQILNSMLLKSDQTRTSDISDEKPTMYLILSCIENEFEFGFKYYFNELSTVEKNILVTDGAEKCIEKLKIFMKRKRYEADEWLYKEDSFLAIRIESILKILLFLIDEMTDLEKLKFLSQNFVVTFQALYVVWPYQELCAEILYFIWDRIQVDEEQFLKLVLINCINIEGITKSPDWSFTVYSLYFRYETLIIEKSFEQLFCITMNVISKEAKEKVLIKDDFENVRKLYEERKYFSLNRIINDIHLAKYREEILIIAVDHLKKHISCRGSSAVTMFFDSMELTEDESKWLKGKLNYINILLISKNIESAYGFLNWLAKLNTELGELETRTDYKHLNWILDRETKEDALEYRTHQFFYDLIESTEFEKFEESEVLKSAKLDLMNIILLNKNIALADKYFKWITNSDTEQIELKKRIDVVEICDFMIKNNDFDKADEFLSWRLDTEEERRKIKRTLNCDDFIWIHILDIWSHSGDRFSLCPRLLKWHFETEEEILNFKASVFKTRNFMEVVLTYWSWRNWNSFYDFDNFLKFWSFSDDEINGIKMGIASNIKSWIETCVIKTNHNVKLLNDLFDWIYEDEKGKAMVVKNFMNSPKGISLLVKCFRNSIDSPKPFVHFLNDWITESTNFGQIFLLVDGFRNYLDEDNLELLKSLLRRKQGGKIVTAFHYSPRRIY